ncbi:MAG: histidine kinase [Proteobacteria bacterium]|nr:histidine kinase [Pseudomonadota bacterium]
MLGWSPPGRPRIPQLAGALIAGSLLGTVLVVLIKGRELSRFLEDSHYLASFALTAGVGVIVGAIASLAMAGRARIAVAERELMRTEAERQKLARQTAEAQLQVLKAQIEPHFLFNTLANLRYLVGKEPGAATRMLDDLIEYLQAAMPRMRGETSTLGQEIAMCNAYLNIHKVRMAERLAFSIDVPKPLLDVSFPPMMLITLIENALKHGLGPLPGGGRIDLVALATDGNIAVSVADTGKGLAADAGSGKNRGVGLTNISDRLAAIYAGKGRLTLSPNSPSGTIARIEVPLDY